MTDPMSPEELRMSAIDQIRQTAANLRAELASPDAPPPTLEEARALAEAAIGLVEENARLTAVAESARSLIAAADACDREAERHPSSRSSAPVVRLINVMARLRQALGGTAPPSPTITACPFCAAEGPGGYACDHTSPKPNRTSDPG